MRMLQFRVQNYKKIEDTGWVKTDELTAFVGKNEAGKSAIFRGLSKLNPSDGELYDGLKEFPRRRYTDEFKTSLPVSNVEFQLEPDEIKNLKEICSALKDAKTVIVSRRYDNKYSVKFNPDPQTDFPTVKDYLKSFQSWKNTIEKLTAPEGKGDDLGTIKTKLTENFNNTISEIEKNYYLDIPSETINKISELLNSIINEEWEKQLFLNIIKESDKYVQMVEVRDALIKAKKWIYENIPQFIYFDRYDILTSAVHIDEFIAQIKANPDDSRLRITKCLFEHVGLDVDQISKLDITNDKKTIEELRRMADERAIKMHAASQAMTKKFQDWWEQRKHQFEYQIDGKNFRVWVSDDLDPSRIELDQRSAGMQYFFSFYLVFLVESARAHVNSILLLDEPGLQYHGTAQQKAVKFLEKVSKDNQLLYTTHSPFMIDGDHLENVRIVYEDEKNYGNTKVSADVWPKDKDSLFPLQAGLGYSLAQTLFYSKYQLVVEGITDYMILKSMNQLLSKKGKTTLNDKIIITPAGGTRNIMPLAGMLTGEDINIVVLLDGDQPGLQKQKDLKEKLLVNCILVSSYTKTKNAEIEDLLPQGLYVDALKSAYPGKDFSFSEEENKIERIVERVESLFKRKNYGKFEKWKPTEFLIDWIQHDSEMKKIDEKTIQLFELIFKKVNEMLK